MPQICAQQKKIQSQWVCRVVFSAHRGVGVCRPEKKLQLHLGMYLRPLMYGARYQVSGTQRALTGYSRSRHSSRDSYTGSLHALKTYPRFTPPPPPPSPARLTPHTHPTQPLGNHSSREVFSSRPSQRPTRTPSSSCPAGLCCPQTTGQGCTSPPKTERKGGGQAVCGLCGLRAEQAVGKEWLCFLSLVCGYIGRQWSERGENTYIFMYLAQQAIGRTHRATIIDRKRVALWCNNSTWVQGVFHARKLALTPRKSVGGESRNLCT